MDNNQKSREIDDLLQIYRRGEFDKDLVKFAEDAIHSKIPLALVMIDLDYFKAVNDKHGHPIGDEVLKSVAKIIKKCTLKKGKCYRYGGEEITLLLQNYSIDEAVSLAERLRREIEASSHSSKQLKVTASFGIANLPEHAEDSAPLLKKADEALYEAKELGRNYVRVSGEPRPTVAVPREPDRREPEPGGLTEKQKEKIRIDYFQCGRAQCPKDQALLNVGKTHRAGRATPDLYIFCPLCGLRLELLGSS